MKVKVVSAYVPLPVRHQTKETYQALGARLIACAPDKFRVFHDYPLEDCWLYKFLDNGKPLPPPASEVPADRYASPQHMVLSNIVQHQRTEWAMMAANENPGIDCIVWIDYGVLKQGDFTGRPVKEHQIKKFIEKVEASDLDTIPFPAIWGKGPVSDTDVNWRFCGSVHIWPVKFLRAIDALYKTECINFIERTHTVPNDLPIWAHVEERGALPFVGYAANHDATQFTNFRPTEDLTPLCQLAQKHLTDKGPYHGYTKVYYDLFKDKIGGVKRVLEVGIGYHANHHQAFWPFGASLHMWAEFFPNAHIYAFDIDPRVMIHTDQITSLLSDQSNAMSLIDGARACGGNFDVIIDDGSHFLEHQVLTVNILMQFLADGGTFIIEDVSDPDTVIAHLPPGIFNISVTQSRAEPDHASLIVITRG